MGSWNCSCPQGRASLSISVNRGLASENKVKPETGTEKMEGRCLLWNLKLVLGREQDWWRSGWRELRQTIAFQHAIFIVPGAKRKRSEEVISVANIYLHMRCQQNSFSMQQLLDFLFNFSLSCVMFLNIFLKSTVLVVQTFPDSFQVANQLLHNPFMSERRKEIINKKKAAQRTESAWSTRILSLPWSSNWSCFLSSSHVCRIASRCSLSSCDLRSRFSLASIMSRLHSSKGFGLYHPNSVASFEYFLSRSCWRSRMTFKSTSILKV